MRTTLDLNEKLLREASRLGGLRTKTDLIHASLEAFIHRKRLEGLMALGGRGLIKLTHPQLHRMRRHG